MSIGSWLGVKQWTVLMSPCGVSFVGTLDHTPPYKTSSMGYLQASSPPDKTILEVKKKKKKINN
jgi:hypothetical protein